MAVTEQEQAERMAQETLRNSVIVLMKAAIVVRFDKNGTAAQCLVCATKNKHATDCLMNGVEAWARANGLIPA